MRKELTEEQKLLKKQKDKEYRDANKEKAKAWREANKEKIKSDNAKWRNENADKKKLSDKNYKEANKEKIKEQNKQYYQENKEKQKLYKQENKEILNEKRRIKYKENREAILEKRKEYTKLNNDKIKATTRKYLNDKYKNDTLFKIKVTCRNLIRKSINKKGYIKNSKTETILGCTFEEFKNHIESLWQPWMNWDNYGLYNGELNYGWDIDHITPLVTATNEEELLKLNHFNNLQPLCSKVNRDIKRDNLSTNR